MRRIFSAVVLVGLVFLVTSNVWALPVAGDNVLMMNDWEVPYSMKFGDEVYQTFCLESSRYFYPNHTYMVASIGDYAEGGGGGAVDGKDKVSPYTKWLYAAYFSDVFNELGDVAQKVQNAIWYLEEEADGVKSDWEDLSPYMAIFDDSGWEVVAVNLTLNGTDNQSQLVGVAPVPEPASMLLLGTGLLGIAAIGRKRLKQA